MRKGIKLFAQFMHYMAGKARFKVQTGMMRNKKYKKAWYRKLLLLKRYVTMVILP
jgi:hypothetical protein